MLSQKLVPHQIQTTSQSLTCTIYSYSGTQWDRGPICTLVPGERLHRTCTHPVQIPHQVTQTQIHRDEEMNQLLRI